MSEYAYTPRNELDAPEVGESDTFDRLGQEVEALEAAFGPGYFDAVSVIEKGIDKSHSRGYAEEKVLLGEHEVPLQYFLATELFRIHNRGDLTKAGLDAILEKYLDKSAPEPEPVVDGPTDVIEAEVIADEPELRPEAPVRTKPYYESGHRRYRDPQSAAAGDYLDDDEK